MRICHSQEFGPHATSSARNRRAKRRKELGRHLPTVPKEIEDNGSFRERGNMSSSGQQRKQIRVVDGPTTIPGYEGTLSHKYGSPLQMLVYFPTCPSANILSA